jgi:hypothetical protein
MNHRTKFNSHRFTTIHKHSCGTPFLAQTATHWDTATTHFSFTIDTFMDVFDRSLKGKSIH